MKEDLPFSMQIQFPKDGRKPGEIIVQYPGDPFNPKILPFAVSSPYGKILEGLRLGIHNEIIKND